MPGCWNPPAHAVSSILCLHFCSQMLYHRAIPLCIHVYASHTVVDRHWLLELGRECKACGSQFQNLDMGTDHLALVSLVQRVSTVTDSNLAGGDRALRRTCYPRCPALLGIQDV